ncbi:MAG: alkaline phosphatase D family protein [Solirubrobacterales bacterium]
MSTEESFAGSASDGDPQRDQPRVSRRRALAAGATVAAGAAASGLPVNHVARARERRKPVAEAGGFDWGVSSGFPLPRGIVLWTRVEGLDRTSKLTLEVATDPDFRKVVHRSTEKARKARDYTVHAKVGRLQPRTEYFYRFATRGSSSRIGRFRTAPAFRSREPIRIGFFSCQAWEAGYYSAHAGLATEKDLDLVVCLGDYIYEEGTYDGPRTDDTGENSDGDVQKLGEYRQKYRLYQSDSNLQDMHAAHPFVSIWDDHEVEDNYAGDQPSSAAEEGQTNYGEPRRVSLSQRRANGYRAFFDAMPRLRRPGEPDRIYGRARLGRMCDLFLLDQRQYRDPQPCGDPFLQPCPTSGAPGRAYLGRDQMDWLKRGLENSPAEWKLLGNQLMGMAFDVAPGVPVVQDSWEGYRAEWGELTGHLLDRGIDDAVFLTGDIHTFFAGEATTTGRIDGTPAATEFVGGSITSLGVKETFKGAPVENLEAGIFANNPHISYADFDMRGYGVVSMRPKGLVCEFKAPGSALVEPGNPEAEVNRLAAFRVDQGTTGAQRIA